MQLSAAPASPDQAPAATLRVSVYPPPPHAVTQVATPRRRSLPLQRSRVVLPLIVPSAGLRASASLLSAPEASGRESSSLLPAESLVWRSRRAWHGGGQSAGQGRCPGWGRDGRGGNLGSKEALRGIGDGGGLATRAARRQRRRQGNRVNGHTCYLPSPYLSIPYPL
nr:unnamed protein product [Digitaria exilis]